MNNIKKPVFEYLIGDEIIEKEKYLDYYTIFQTKKNAYFVTSNSLNNLKKHLKLNSIKHNIYYYEIQSKTQGFISSGKIMRTGQVDYHVKRNESALFSRKKERKSITNNYMKIELNIHSEILKRKGINEHDIRMILGVSLLKHKIASLGKIAQIVGIEKIEFQEKLGNYDGYMNVGTLKDILEDCKNA